MHFDMAITIAIWKGTRECIKHLFYLISNFMLFECSSCHKRLFVSLNIESISNILSKTSSYKNRKMLWTLKYKLWEVVELPKEKRSRGCKLVFTIKYKADGTREIQSKIDSQEIYPNIWNRLSRDFCTYCQNNHSLSSIVSSYQFWLETATVYVKNALSYKDVQEEIYMEIRPEFTKNARVTKVCRLNDALYGFKQSPRA